MCDTKVLLSLWVNHDRLKPSRQIVILLLYQEEYKLRRDGWLHVMWSLLYDFLPFPEIPFCSCTCLIVKDSRSRTGKEAAVRRGKARKPGNLETCIYIARKKGSHNRECRWLLLDGFPLLKCCFVFSPAVVCGRRLEIPNKYCYLATVCANFLV